MIVTVAAIIFSILILIIVLFQIGLAIGMPWGEYTMGGYFPGRFPWRLRLLAIIQAVLLVLFAIIVLDKADVFHLGIYLIPSFAIWVVVAFSFFTTILNSITKSKKEKRIWFPISVLMIITSLIVAFS